MPFSSRVAIVAALGVVVAGACTFLNPLDGYTDGDAGTPVDDAGTSLADTSASADSSTEDGPSATCNLRKAPERAEGGAGGGTLTFVNALDSFEFSDPSDPAKANRTGLDLDGVCTCPGTRSCRPLKGAGICDYPDGVDNAAGEFFLSLFSVIGREANETAKIRRGEHGLVVRLRNYNGLPDDDEVEVAIFNSFGLDIPADAGLPDGAAPVPKFDGTDRWTIDSKSLLGGAAYVPNIVDARAYVRGGVVVGKVNNSIRIGPYIVPITAGVLTARLKKMGDSFGVDEGIVSGRSNARELLTALENVPNPLDKSKYLCGADAVFTNLRDRFCANLDLATDPTLDGKESPCDAASFSIRFTSSPAELGKVVDTGAPRKPCGESWVATCPQ